MGKTYINKLLKKSPGLENREDINNIIIDIYIIPGLENREEILTRSGEGERSSCATLKGDAASTTDTPSLRLMTLGGIVISDHVSEKKKSCFTIIKSHMLLRDIVISDQVSSSLTILLTVNNLVISDHVSPLSNMFQN